MSSPEAVVRELYDAFASKDDATLRRVIHPDVLWIQCDGFPGGGVRHGADEVFSEVFGALRGTWEDWAAEVEEYLPAGDTVVVLGRYTGRHRETKKSVVSVFAHVYDVEDGRVVRFRQIADTAPMTAAATAART